MSNTDNFECVYLENKYIDYEKLNKKPVCTFYCRLSCRSECPHYGDCDYCEHQLGEEYCSTCEMLDK